MSEREQRVRERAHAIWLAEGQPSGREHAHWEQASREVDRAAAKPKAPAQRKPAAKPANDVAGKTTAKPAAKQPAKPKAKKAEAPAPAPAKRKTAKRG